MKAIKAGDVRVEFVLRENGPERLVCEAELHFSDKHALAGLKLVGFSLWKGLDDLIYVTMPSRAFGAGSDRRYFDYLRAVLPSGSSSAPAKKLQEWIVEQWLAQPKGGR